MRHCLPRRRCCWMVLLALVGLGLGGIGGGMMFLVGCSAFGSRAQGERLARMQASPQWQDGRFVNSLPPAEVPHFRAAGKWIRGGEHTTPAEPPPVRTLTAAELAQAPSGELRVTWLGHSSFLLELEGWTVLVDPVWSPRASPVSWAGPTRFFPPPLSLDDLPRLDAVVISHDHYDHLDLATIRALGERALRYLVPLGVGAHLEGWGVPPDRIRELDWWEEYRLGEPAVPARPAGDVAEGVHASGRPPSGELTLVATPARHFSGRSPLGNRRDSTLWAGWAFLGQRHRVYYSGDTALFPGLREIGARLGPFDLTLIETGAYNSLWADYHLGPEQAVLAHRLVQGRLLLPVHWGTFNLALHGWTEPVERLLAAASRAGVAVIVPRPGERVEPAAPFPLVRWWPPLPWQTAARAPVISSGLPSELRRELRQLTGGREVVGGTRRDIRRAPPRLGEAANLPEALSADR